MKWIFTFVLILGLQAQAQTEMVQGDSKAIVPVSSPQELVVADPSTSTTEANVSGSATAAAVSEAEIPVTQAETTPKKDVKESEIPVNLEAGKKAAAHENPAMRIFLSFLIVAALGGAAYFLLRKYRYTAGQKSEATQIKILSQYYLGPKKSLAIVRVAGESILIGVTDQNISMIKSLSLLDEDIPEDTPKEFHTVFTRKNEVTPVSEDPENRDDFSISGIKDFVSTKLKNMRSFE